MYHLDHKSIIYIYIYIYFRWLRLDRRTKKHPYPRKWDSTWLMSNPIRLHFSRKSYRVYRESVHSTYTP